MISKFIISISFAATFQILLHSSICHPLEMTVYYESLCPDCQRFFVDQFQPNYEKFINYVNWILIPYGNARTKRYANGTVRSVKCQHEDAECYGNTVQACVLRKIPDAVTQTRFCLCFMVNRGDVKALEKCARTYELDYNAINTCAKSREGLEFLADYGNIQREAWPPIEAVPTLALKQKQLSGNETTEFFTNTCKFFCDRLAAPKPEACNACPAPPTAAPTTTFKTFI